MQNFLKSVSQDKNRKYFLVSDSIPGKNSNFLGFFLHGLKLKSYEFNKYKSKKDTKVISIDIVGKNNKPSSKST